MQPSVFIVLKFSFPIFKPKSFKFDFFICFFISFSTLDRGTISAFSEVE